MDRSTTHEAARLAACRLPALAASLALLVEDTAPARIELYATARPDPGGPPGDDPVVVLVLDEVVGTLDAALFQIQLTVPAEGQVTGAESAGSDVLWARILDGSGDWWADGSVSDGTGTGELQVASITLYNGAFCRLTSAIFQG